MTNGTTFPGRNAGGDGRSASPPADGSFERRVVAFVDILGFRSLLRRMGNEPSLFDTLRDALETVADHRTAAAQAAVFDSSYLHNGLEMSAFSDCYAISAFAGHEGLVVRLTARLALSLLEIGVLSRGAIVRGELYHRHPVVFGQALVDAYELERSIAVYPRIIIDESVVHAVADAAVSRDDDGYAIVDPFSVYVSRPVDQRADPLPHSYMTQQAVSIGNRTFVDVCKSVRGYLVENLVHELAAEQINPSHLSKLQWQVRTFNKAMATKSEIGIDSIDPENPVHEIAWD